jgi:SAM-dependent methyltransferase
MTLPRDYDVNQGIYAHIADMLSRAGARLIADIGCGEGALAAAAPSPQTQIIGIDASPAAVTANMLYHLRDPAAGIREAYRILRQGGQFIATAVSRHDSTKPPLSGSRPRPPSMPGKPPASWHRSSELPRPNTGTHP